MMVIGCDPGLTGAISLIDPGRGLLECQDIPTSDNGTASGKMRRWVDIDATVRLLAGWSLRHEFALAPVLACIERPIPMPTLPAQTIASQFDTFGALRALLGLRTRHQVSLAEPKVWKKFYGLGTDKDASRECALRLYPSAPVTRVKDHNRAEAILIAHWHMRTTQ